MKMYVYLPGCIPTVEELPYARFQAMKPKLIELLGCEHVEHVSVLFQDPATGKEIPTDMFVDEDGHAKGRAFNKAATDIYHHYSVTRTGADPQELPVIAGPAIVFDTPIWS